jgi:hypothetical protein
MNNELPDRLARFPPPLRPLVSWLQLDAPIQGYAPIGGLGYLWLLGGLPSIALLSIQALRNPAAASRRELLFTLVLILLLLAVQPAPWWARFTLWMHVLGLSCLVRLLQELASGSGAWRAPLSLGLLVGAIGLASGESERTLALEAETGRVAREGAPGSAYVSTRDMYFAGMDDHEGFDRLLAAPAIARSLWSRAGTLLGGSLAVPLGQRTILLLPEKVSADDLDRAQKAGVEWVLWDTVGAGDTPALLRERAAEESRYHPSPDVDFRALRLRSQAAAAE